MLPKSAEVFRSDLLEWSEDNLRDYPWRERGATLYEVFIAEFLLTQTPAENVADLYTGFLAKYPDLGAIDSASEDQIVEDLKPVGFQNRRAEALKAIASSIDQIPTSREELTALPRVGEYIADATLCFALDQPISILDRNVERVYSRVFGNAWPEISTGQREFADDLLPPEKERIRRYNLALLDFGASLCTSQLPRCEECWANEYCVAYLSGSV